MVRIKTIMTQRKTMSAKSSLLIVVIAHVLLATLASDAFYFWSSKFATMRSSNSSSSSSNRAQEAPSQRQRFTPTASTTTTTTTTLRPPPPTTTISSIMTSTQLPAAFELQFEINSDSDDSDNENDTGSDTLSDHRQSNITLTSDEGNETVQPLNGTLILEDLVHQMERHFNQKKRGADHTMQTTNDDESNLQRLANESSMLGGPSVRLAELVVEPMGSLNDTGDTLSSYKPTTNDVLVEPQSDQDDRHIQYDMSTSSSSSSEQLDQRHHRPDQSPFRGANSRLVAAKDGESAGTVASSGQSAVPKQMSRIEELSAGNFTLKPIQVQSELLTLSSSSSSSSERLGNESTTASGNASTMFDQDDDNEADSSHQQGELVMAKNRNQSVVAAEQPTVVATSGQHQGRSMSGTTSRLPQHSKPPYASYNQFHHRSELQPGASLVITTNNHRGAATGASGNQHQQHQQINATLSTRQEVPTAASGQLHQHQAANETQQSDANRPKASSSFGSSGANSAFDTQKAQSSKTDLASSIKLISSHLMQEEAAKLEATASAKSRAAATTTTTTTTTTSTTAAPVAMYDAAYQSYEHMRELVQRQQYDELKRVEAKLRPVNEPIDLSPIPAASYNSIAASSSGSNSASGSPQMAASDLAGHYFYLSAPAPDELQDGLVSARYQNDRYTNNHSNSQPPGQGLPAATLSSEAAANQLVMNMMAADASESSKFAIRSTQAQPARYRQQPQRPSASSSSAGGSGNDYADAVAPSLSLPFGPQLHKKTLELLSNQIQHSDQNLLQVGGGGGGGGGGGINSVQHQHKERSPNSLESQTGPLGDRGATQVGGGQAPSGGHAGRSSYAASLINVTAPMVLPLSATEAMEASLAGDQAAKQLMHQVGGHSMLGGGGGPGATSSTTAATIMLADQADHQPHSTVAPSGGGSSQRPAPHRTTSYYVIPAALDQQQLRQSIYSRPANQFSPRPQYPVDADLTSASSADMASGGSMVTMPSVNSVGSTLSAVDRLRLGDPGASHTIAPGQQASGFRSPSMSQQQHLLQQQQQQHSSSGETGWPHTAAAAGLPTPSSYLSSLMAAASGGTGTSGAGRFQSASSTLAPSSGSNRHNQQAATNSSASSGGGGGNSPHGSSGGALGVQVNHHQQPPTSSSSNSKNVTNNQTGSLNLPVVTTNGFITGTVSNATGPQSPSLSGGGGELQPQSATGSSSSSGGGGGPGSSVLSSQVATGSSQQQGAATGSGGHQLAINQGGGGGALNKRVSNLTRVEHISAECSNDLIRTVIIFNGTFKGIIYSSGYVRDPQCLYINGTGKTRYDFSIKLNQCGTLGRQEIHPPSGPNEVRRRDQVMWNTLSIQYNPIIEQEWDEHFRVSCEYGSDFWKTISFSPFNVETNTGSPVVFTVDPPQCQMEILKGHGMVGPRQEAVSGPVTVGDPLTLLIHMKSEKAGYDILVKNCIAHNGGQQKMQLIDSNGCVVNERFISPFRGTYNDNDLKHVTLYSYLKAFRFTGSPVLYLECEVHMCQSACPPQMCYWRRLSKRSANHSNDSRTWQQLDGPEAAFIDQAGEDNGAQFEQFDLGPHGSDALPPTGSDKSIRFNLTTSTSTTTTTTTEPSTIGRKAGGRREARKMRSERHDDGSSSKRPHENLSDRVSLFQALEVRQEREPDNLAVPYSYDELASVGSGLLQQPIGRDMIGEPSFMCYRRAELFAFMFTVASILLAAISVTIGCCLRASALRRQMAHSSHKKTHDKFLLPPALGITGINKATTTNLAYSTLSSYYNSTPASLSPSASSCSSTSPPTPPRQSLRPLPPIGSQAGVCGGPAQERYKSSSSLQIVNNNNSNSNNKDFVYPQQAAPQSATTTTAGPPEYSCLHNATSARLNQHRHHNQNQCRGNSRIKRASKSNLERRTNS